MKKKRIVAAIVILIVVAAIVIICIKKNGKTSNGSEGFSIVKTDTLETEDGVFHRWVNEDSEYFLKYLDYQTGNDVIVCNKPDCTHSDDTCMGFYADFVKANQDQTGDTFMGQIFEMNKKLYVGAYDYGNLAGLSSTTIYRQDTDGNNREKLFTVEDEAIQTILCANDSFYFVTISSDKDLLEQYKDKELSDTEEEIIWSSNYVNLYRYDASSDELTCIAEHIYEQSADYGPQVISSDSETGFYIFSTWQEDGTEHHDLAFYDVVEETLTKNAVDFAEQGQNIQISPVCIRDNRFYYMLSQLDADGWAAESSEFAYYDIASGKTVSIADAAGFSECSLMDDRLIINMGYGEDSSGEPEYTYRRYAYYDFDEDEFYVLDEGAPAPKYSSGDKGVVDRTDYYAMEYLGETIDEYSYEIVDMERYYKENWHKYSGDYNGFITVY